MEAILLNIAREVVICRDARSRSVLFQARIPSSESKCVCGPANRELGTSGRMTLFGTVRLLLSKKVTGVHRLDNLLHNQTNSLSNRRQV